MPSTAAPAYQIELRQRLTVMKNRWDLVAIEPAGERSLAYAEQARITLREKVTFWTDETRTATAFTLNAQNIIDLAGTYTLADAGGQVLATISKQLGASLARSTYQVAMPGGQTMRVHERSQWRAIGRRIVGIVTDLPWLFPIQFDVLGPDGRTVATIDRKLALKDTYAIAVFDQSLDWRVMGAIAVAADAFMNR